MKYYRVLVPMGHMGKKKYLETNIYVQALNIFEAIEGAKAFPGIKHSKMPFQAVEITEQMYQEGLLKQEYYKNINRDINFKKSEGVEL